jgi:hypothetical protein
MTPQSCATCTHWRETRPSADYGTCTKIIGIERTLAGESKAYVFATFSCDPGAHVNVSLHTHKSFDCSHFEPKDTKTRNVVDAVVDASRALAGLPPLERRKTTGT